MPPKTDTQCSPFRCAHCQQGFPSVADYNAHACPESTYTSAPNTGEDIQYSPVESSSSATSAPLREQNLSSREDAKNAKDIPLAPCPWCKKTPTLEEDDDGVTIVCETTGCLVAPRLELPDTNGDTVAEITAVWNRCAPPAPAAKPLAAETERALQALRARLPMEVQNALAAWVMMRRRKRFPVSVALVNKWSRFLAAQGEAAFIAALIHSTEEEYMLLVPAPREAQPPKAAKKGDAHGKGF